MKNQDHPPVIAISKGMFGYFPSCLTWDDEYGFYSPEYSGGPQTQYYKDSIAGAKRMAEDEGVTFTPLNGCEVIQMEHNSVLHANEMKAKLAALRAREARA
jgi:hypothetical protein